MPTQSTQALVLKKTKLGEADLIITMLSKEGMQIRGVAKGARKPASRYAATLELYSLVDVLLYTGKNLDTITEAHVIEANTCCRQDIEHASSAAIVAELLTKVTENGENDPTLFAFANRSIQAIGEAPLCRLSIMAATSMVKLCALIGFRPALGRCALCGSPSEEGTFSALMGGALCQNCASEGIAGGADCWSTDTLKWAQVLLASTFDQIESMDFENPDKAFALGKDLLYFAKSWCDIHLSLRLKALDTYLCLL